MKEVKYRAWDKELKVMYPHVQDWYDTLTNEYYPINPVIYYAGVINDHDGDYEEWYCGFCLDDVWHTPVRKDDEVIGNIYENPELLEEK